MKTKTLLVATAVSAPILFTPVFAESDPVEILVQIQGTETATVEIVPADDVSAATLETETVFTVTQNAAIVFAPTEPGDFYYRIYQPGEKNQGIILDETEYKAHLHSEYNGAGELDTVTVLYKNDDTAKTDEIRFENKKVGTPISSTDTSDKIETWKYLGIIAVCLMITGMIIIFRTKSDDEN